MKALCLPSVACSCPSSRRCGCGFSLLHVTARNHPVPTILCAWKCSVHGGARRRAWLHRGAWPERARNPAPGLPGKPCTVAAQPEGRTTTPHWRRVLARPCSTLYCSDKLLFEGFINPILFPYLPYFVKQKQDTAKFITPSIPCPPSK